ncbi:MAG: hypothetical protein K0Q55_1862, partial [Verrucomicrobia bacterium]|jgi:hypothetical protein|nr:hypothetical protein [Verrucomicrobiota bacterium]
LLSENYHLLLSLFCPILGALIGWRQIHSEQHRDLRAYLVHRPVELRTLFHAKLIAGLGLYALIVGVPMLGFYLWASVPGNFAAPFEWSMGLSLIAFFLAGITGYFAAMLTMLRPVKWIGSRTLPCVLTFLAGATAFGMSDFVTEIITILLLLLVLAGAAQGAFLTNGEYRGHSFAAKSALVIALTVAFAALCLMGTVPIVAALQMKDDQTWTYYNLATDENIYKSVTTKGKVEVFDLEGKTFSRSGQKLDQEEIKQFFSVDRTWVYLWPRQIFNPFRNANDYFVHWKSEGDIHWFYWHTHGRLAGYHTTSRSFIGSIGPDGFSTEIAGLPSFSGAFKQGIWDRPYFLTTDTTVYDVNLGERTVKPVYQVDATSPILGINSTAYSATRKQPLLVTEKAVHLLNGEGKKIMEVAVENLPRHLSRHSEVRLYSFDKTNRHALWLEPSFEENKKAGGAMSAQVIWFNLEEGVTKRSEIPSQQSLNSNDYPPRLYLVTATAPPLLAGLICILDKFNAKLLGYAFAFALLHVGIGLWWGRRYQFSGRQQVGWGFFLLLTGLPGLLAFFCARDWPVRVTCPGCKKLRSVEQEHCEHCQTPFPLPEKNGVEIFETAMAE